LARARATGGVAGANGPGSASRPAKIPHPELHGGKKSKPVWATLEDSGMPFLEFVERHHLEHEEGNLFSYLVRVMTSVDVRLIDDRKW